MSLYNTKVNWLCPECSKPVSGDNAMTLNEAKAPSRHHECQHCHIPVRAVEVEEDSFKFFRSDN